jgi:tetratricopeptide (TPR) repeat protein
MDRLHDLVARRGLVDDEDGVEGTLSRQKALFAQRKRISAFADVGDTKSALHWLTRLIASDAALLHWSDQYRLFRIGLASGQPRKLLLEALLKLPECALLSAVSGGSRSNAMLCLLALELSEALGDWEGLLRGAEALERQLEEASPGDESSSLRWEREQFPAGWVPAADASVLRARVAFFRGRALRALGDFEAAIEAFSRATDHDPHAFSAVSELVDESNALIPAGQRKAYMGTLIIDDDPEPIAYDYSVDELFANGQYASVLQHTQPLFREPKALPLPDARLLVLHLGALLALRKANDLFALAHRLVDAVPQSGLPWYAVGLYYEAVGKFDDSRRYLMYTTAMPAPTPYGPPPPFLL